MMLLKKILGLSFSALLSFQGQTTPLEENDEVILLGQSYPISSTEEIKIESFSGRRFIPIPDAIGNLINLKTLIITCSFRGIIPESIGQLSSLRDLNLSHNQLTGSIPASIGQLSSLTNLKLFNNQLTGSIPESIGQLNSLRDLDLYRNQLTGSIPASIGNLRSLKYLTLSSSQLTGSIPESIGQLSSLRELDLYRNQLTGRIPASIGNLRSLKYLHLSYNQLTGSISESIGQLNSLMDLDLSSNQLTGSIPESIGHLSNLTNLDLSSNQLTGSIPESIGHLSSLTNLDLSSNQLTGMYANLFTLSGALRLAHNHLNLIPGSQTLISVKSSDVTIGVGGESFNPKLFTCFEQKIDEPVYFHLSGLQGTPVIALEGYTIWFKKEKDEEGKEKDIIEGEKYGKSLELSRTNLPPVLQKAVTFILSEKNFKGDIRKSARNH